MAVCEPSAGQLPPGAERPKCAPGHHLLKHPLTPAVRQAAEREFASLCAAADGASCAGSLLPEERALAIWNLQ